jgi:hypothetical protein
MSNCPNELSYLSAKNRVRVLVTNSLKPELVPWYIGLGGCKCKDCRCQFDAYMVTDAVWKEARLDEKDDACLPCLSKRLGRDLVLQDFTTAPINRTAAYLLTQDLEKKQILERPQFVIADKERNRMLAVFPYFTKELEPCNFDEAVRAFESNCVTVTFEPFTSLERVDDDAGQWG